MKINEDNNVVNNIKTEKCKNVSENVKCDEDENERRKLLAIEKLNDIFNKKEKEKSIINSIKDSVDSYNVYIPTKNQKVNLFNANKSQSSEPNILSTDISTDNNIEFYPFKRQESTDLIPLE